MDLLRTEPTPSSSRFPYTTLFRSGTVSGRSNGRVRPRGRRRLSEAGGRLQPRAAIARDEGAQLRSEEHTSELQSRQYLVCRLLVEKKKNRLLYCKSEIIQFNHDTI